MQESGIRCRKQESGVRKQESGGFIGGCGNDNDDDQLPSWARGTWSCSPAAIQCLSKSPCSRCFLHLNNGQCQCWCQPCKGIKTSVHCGPNEVSVGSLEHMRVYIELLGQLGIPAEQCLQCINAKFKNVRWNNAGCDVKKWKARTNFSCGLLLSSPDWPNLLKWSGNLIQKF